VSEIAGSFRAGVRVVAVAHPDTDARPGWSSVVGARNPYVARSRASFEVPVLAATGRRVPPLALKTASFADQMGFCFLSVFPARISLTRKAACWETAAVPVVCGACQMTWPSGARSQDHPGRDADAAVGQRAVCRREVDGPDLDGAQRAASPAWR
jgi:hypothetical protein